MQDRNSGIFVHCPGAVDGTLSQRIHKKRLAEGERTKRLNAAKNAARCYHQLASVRLLNKYELLDYRRQLDALEEPKRKAWMRELQTVGIFCGAIDHERTEGSQDE